MRILAIADDTTGAIEVGAKFAMAGVRTLVTTDDTLECDADALVIDAQTRHLSPVRAYERIVRLAIAAREAGIPYVFKKTDSTLRGNIAAEFQALIDAFAERPLLYVPAYPRMGRVVTSSELYVHGAPLSQTAFAHDPLNPSVQGWIPALLSVGCGAPILTASDGERIRELLTAAPGGVIILCDGATDDDLQAAAEALAATGRPSIVAGTAGFCEPWVRAVPVEKTFQATSPAVLRCVVVSGSVNPVSQEQIQRAAEAGIPAITLAEQPEGDAQTAEELAAMLGVHAWVSLATPRTCPRSVSERIGALVVRILEAQPLDGLVVFGGDTTRAILDALGVSVVEPCRDVLPGIPVSVIQHGDRRLALITKAGGFGDRDTLGAIRQTLEERS